MSMNSRQSSRLRFGKFREEWRKSRSGLFGGKPEVTAKPGFSGEASVARHALSRIIPCAGRSARDDRAGVAVALLRDPAAVLAAGGHQDRDRQRAWRQGSARLGDPRVAIPTRPESRLAPLIATVFVVTVIGTVVNIWGRWLATGRRNACR